MPQSFGGIAEIMYLCMQEPIHFEVNIKNGTIGRKLQKFKKEERRHDDFRVVMH